MVGRREKTFEIELGGCLKTKVYQEHKSIWEDIGREWPVRVVFAGC